MSPPVLATATATTGASTTAGAPERAAFTTVKRPKHAPQYAITIWGRSAWKQNGDARGEDAWGGEYGRVRMVAIGEGWAVSRSGRADVEEGQLSRGTDRW